MTLLAFVLTYSAVCSCIRSQKANVIASD